MAAHELHHVQQAGTSIATVLRPASLEAAAQQLRDTPDARLLAGGSDLLLDLQRGGPGAPITVVDLSGIEGFRQITESDEDIILAGGVTHA
ncbi:MAG: hypothetical protein HKN94_06020, partial [Acidimicrobiales bacterium]|nr:hypothetical protein [Acidimicrobiales bacterium]